MKHPKLMGLYFIIFVTGASGLIFQVTWQKYVSRLLGSDNIATAIILGTFLGGLSLGYFLCGKFSLRIKNHFKAYAFLEGIVGIWCILFPQIFTAVDALTRSWSFAPPMGILVQGIVCAALLMGVPTIAMGGTIPFLTRGISRNITEATHVHASIYAINTTGAFVGTLVAGFYLIPTFGLPLTIMATAFLNLGACLAVYLLASGLKSARTTEESSTPPVLTHIPDSAAAAPIFPDWVLYTIVFLSGFYVMTLENVLIRITNIAVGSSSYTFSLIVAVFILSIAIGSSIIGRFHHIPRWALYVNQLLVTGSLLLIYLSLDIWPYWAHLIRITFQSNLAGFWGYYIGIFLALAVILLLPVAFMGATIPLAFHELKRDLQHVGTHSGLLFSWNTLGNLLGSLIGGIVLYYLLNNARVFLLAVLLAACSAWLASWRLSRKYLLVPTGLIVLVGLFMFFTPYYQQHRFIIGTFHFRQPLDFSFDTRDNFFHHLLSGKILKFYTDGPNTTVAVLEFPEQSLPQLPSRSIYVNGKSDSNTVGDMATLKLAAHLPALLAESRKEVMVIGLGTGVTAGEFTLYSDVEHIDVAEIAPAVVKALPFFQDATHGLSEDPRVTIHLGDAFRILGRSKKKWDIITSEPSNPWVTGVDLLFTREFYRLAKDHLTEHGILLQWVQLYDTNPDIMGMILNTVQQEFAQVKVFRAHPADILVVATNTQFTESTIVNLETVFQKEHHVRTSLSSIYIDNPDALLMREIWSSSYIKEHFSHLGIQTMDNPRLHYIAGKSFFMEEKISEDFLLRAETTTFLSEYLLTQKYPHWKDSSFLPATFPALLSSTTERIHGGSSYLTDSLALKGYLHNSKVFPLTDAQKNAFHVELFPFITDLQPEEQWGKLSLEGSSFRQKAEVLLRHVQRFRNWIVPYPLDGLQAVLRAGMIRGQDAYEKNWCTLQLARLVLREHHDRPLANSILQQLHTQDDGTILLSAQDSSLLAKVNRLLNR